MSEKKLENVADLRAAINCTPQMKLHLASAIDNVLRQNGMRLSGGALGGLNFCSNTEIEQIGGEPASAMWTI